MPYARRARSVRREYRLAAGVCGPAMPIARAELGSPDAFAPGHDVPDVTVEDFRRTTRAAFAGANGAINSYVDRRTLHELIEHIAPSEAVRCVRATEAMVKGWNLLKCGTGLPCARSEPQCGLK